MQLLQGVLSHGVYRAAELDTELDAQCRVPCRRLEEHFDRGHMSLEERAFGCRESAWHRESPDVACVLATPCEDIIVRLGQLICRHALLLFAAILLAAAGQEAFVARLGHQSGATLCAAHRPDPRGVSRELVRVLLAVRCAQWHCSEASSPKRRRGAYRSIAE